jgi:hypothetical protein
MITMRRPGRSGTPLGRLAWLLLAAAAPASATAADVPVTVLVDGDYAATDLACPGTGQAIYGLDGRAGGVIAVDPQAPAGRRIVVGPPAADGPRPLAIACIDANTLAALCRGGDAWSIRTWRIRPDATTEFAAAVQEISVGEAAGPAEQPHLLVSPFRDWILASGLPGPLPPLVRGSVAGTRVGRIAGRSCPTPPEDGRVVAVAANRRDEIIMLATRQGRPARLTVHGLSGQMLLEIDCDVPAPRDAACAADGTLWVLGGDRSDERPEGLWRIDAALDRGRQVARPVCVARIADPRAVACVAAGVVAVAHGGSGGGLVQIDVAPRPAPPESNP